MNVNIFLRQFRVSHSEIVDWLRVGVSETIGGEKLRGLLRILPESDDIERLTLFSGDKNKLGNAEKFYLELMMLPK